MHISYIYIYNTVIIYIYIYIQSICINVVISVMSTQTLLRVAPFLGDRSGRRQLSGVERLKTISASLDAKSPVELGLDAGGSRTQNAPTQLFLAMGI